MRPTKPPRLHLRPARKGRQATWVILDHGREIGTGKSQSQRRDAELALAAYIQGNRQPHFGNGHPTQVLIGDCLAIYCQKHGPKIARPDGLKVEILRLADFFGDKLVDAITEELCGEYVTWRCSQTDARAKKNAGKKIAVSTARRELVTLSAALNWCYRNKRLDRPVVVHLPEVASRRDRYLTRSQVAALLLGALGWDLKTGKRNKFRINRHVARFILVALYTGTRHDAILRLQWGPSTVGGWLDLDAGILYRRPQDAIETNKRRTPCPIPSRLMPHLKRWRRLTARFVIEHNGKPIASQERRAWNGARKLAGLGPGTTPHVLKHTCATLLLQAGKSPWDVAGVLGTSEQVIRDVYGHHSMSHMRDTMDVWSKRPTAHVSPMKLMNKTRQNRPNRIKPI
jgi:integrase